MVWRLLHRYPDFAMFHANFKTLKLACAKLHSCMLHRHTGKHDYKIKTSTRLAFSNHRTVPLLQETVAEQVVYRDWPSNLRKGEGPLALLHVWREIATGGEAVWCPEDRPQSHIYAGRFVTIDTSNSSMTSGAISQSHRPRKYDKVRASKPQQSVTDGQEARVCRQLSDATAGGSDVENQTGASLPARKNKIRPLFGVWSALYYSISSAVVVRSLLATATYDGLIRVP